MSSFIKRNLIRLAALFFFIGVVLATLAERWEMFWLLFPSAFCFVLMMFLITDER